ncbi:MAG TPA: hypothetical protein VJO35_06700 [Terriglobales bacterium]|nr:hypothetical protein [Terriglobales bacterium]
MRQPSLLLVSFWFAAVAGVFAQTGITQKKTIAERFGYPSDAKLLIIHAYDLAVAHSVA